MTGMPREWQAETGRLAVRAVADGAPTRWFEELYAAARRGEVEMPWDREAPFPLLVPWLAVRSVEPAVLRIVGLALTIGAIVAIGFDWWRTALGLVIVAAPVEAIALALATVRLQGASASDRLGRTRQALLGAALIALGWRLMATGDGWGALLLAAVLVATMAALALARHVAVGLRTPVAAWLIDGDAIPLLLIPFAALDLWTPGLGLATVYAFVSLLALELLLGMRAAQA